jgi:opacity protein-like surface antigen
MKSPMLLLLFMIAFSASAFSQAADSTAPSPSMTDREILLYGGRSFSYLPQEFRDVWKNGWNGGLGYGISFAPGTYGYGAVYATLEFNRFALNDAGYRSRELELGNGNLSYKDTAFVQTAGFVRRGSVKTFTGMINFRGTFSSTKQSIAPYFIIGVGFLHYSADSVALRDSLKYSVSDESSSAFAWTFGVGVEIPVTGDLALFAEARSVIGVYKETKQYFPISGGIRYRFPR